MKCIMRIAICTIAVQVLSVLATRDATATTITLNLIQAGSHILQTGDFSTLPMLPQDGLAGTTDFNAARPSNDTTFTGSVTIDVDNLFAPTSIKILGRRCRPQREVAARGGAISRRGRRFEFWRIR
jgi:hypothetical protein